MRAVQPAGIVTVPYTDKLRELNNHIWHFHCAPKGNFHNVRLTNSNEPCTQKKAEIRQFRGTKPYMPWAKYGGA